MNRNLTRAGSLVLFLQKRSPKSEEYRAEHSAFVASHFSDFRFHFVLCLQTQLPKSEKYWEERSPFSYFFLVFGVSFCTLPTEVVPEK